MYVVRSELRHPQKGPFFPRQIDAISGLLESRDRANPQRPIVEHLNGKLTGSRRPRLRRPSSAEVDALDVRERDVDRSQLGGSVDRAVPRVDWIGQFSTVEQLDDPVGTRVVKVDCIEPDAFHELQADGLAVLELKVPGATRERHRACLDARAGPVLALQGGDSHVPRDERRWSRGAGCGACRNDPARRLGVARGIEAASRLKSMRWMSASGMSIGPSSVVPWIGQFHVWIGSVSSRPSSSLTTPSALALSRLIASNRMLSTSSRLMVWPFLN